MKKIEGINFLKGDFLDKKLKLAIIQHFNSKIDVILSDMASNTTGNKSLDCIRTNQLCLDVLEFSKDRLNKKGVVVSKLFMGEEFEQIKNALPNIERIVSVIIDCLKNNGKLIYIGCGTSGRLGVLDSAECPPTVSTSDEVQAFIAGGYDALHKSVENAEDSVSEAFNLLNNKD